MTSYFAQTRHHRPLCLPDLLHPRIFLKIAIHTIGCGAAVEVGLNGANPMAVAVFSLPGHTP